MPMSQSKYIPRTLSFLFSCFVLAGCARHQTNDWQGYVEGEYVYFATSQAGRLDHLSVERGQQIAVGAPLFSLESANEIAAQQQAQNQLKAVEAQLADIQSGRRPQELAVTRAQLVQAQIAFERAKIQLKQFESLYPAGGISKLQLDDARAAAKTTAAKVEELQSQLTVAQLANRTEQIRAQQSQVASAQDVLAQANWRLAQKTVNATRAGLVFDTLYREGEWVNAGNPVVRMLPPEGVKIRFFVPEAVLGQLKVNQTITLNCDSCTANLPAHISYISTNAEFTPPIIYSNETRAKLVYMIEAKPDLADAPKLHVGQPLSVKLS
ncbi:MAG: HlyD family efflux transporter periplasmic adaptor subunit [Aquirhabdus sp.]